MSGRWNWKNKWIYVLAFVLPIMVFVGHMVMTRIKPFGAFTLLYGDASSQIYPALLECRRLLEAGEGINFSWNNGLGTNYYVVFVMYMLSPFHWPLMLVPEAWLEIAMSVVMIVKVALTSVTAVYYFMHGKVLKNSGYQVRLSLLLGVSYGLSSAVLCYFFYPNWLESYMLLPLVLLALENLIDTGRWKLYYFTLVGIMFSYFYMAFGVCIFLVLWFIIQADFQQMKTRFLKFAGVSVMAAITAGIAFVPALAMIGIKYKPDYSNEPGFHFWKITSVWEYINETLPFNSLDMYGNHFETFNVYCGSIAFVAVLFYLLFSKDKLDTRLKLTLGYGFMVFSLLMHGMIYLWHGLALPHGLMNRFAFCLVFLTLYIAAKGIREMLEAGYIKIAITVVLWIGLYAGCLAFAEGLSGATSYIAGLMIMALYFMAWVFLRRKSITRNVFVYFLVVVGLLEVVISSGFDLHYGRWECWEGISDYNRFTSAFAYQNDETGRVGSEGKDIKNPGVLYGKKSASLFHSLMPETYSDTYRKLGLYMLSNGAVVRYRGTTALTDLLFNVETVVAKDAAYYHGEQIEEIEGYQVMDTNASVGYGFMTQEALLDQELEYGNVFDNQNQIASAMGAQDNLFELIPLELQQVTVYEEDCILAQYLGDNQIGYCHTNILLDNGELREITSAKELDGLGIWELDVEGTFLTDLTCDRDLEDAYLYVENASRIRVMVSVNDEPLLSNMDEYVGCMLHLGALQAGDVITLTLAPQTKSVAEGDIQVYLADYNQEVFDEIKSQVSAQPLQVQTMDANGMKAAIDVKEAGLLYTSVPDDGGFDMYVDGKQVEFERFQNLFICVPLSVGEHEIEFRYHVPGLQMGAWCSLLGLGLLAICWNFERIRAWIKGMKKAES